ncbi:MAG: hypothetical protein WA734_11535 [Candidatus Acidiferrales bacterium]
MTESRETPDLRSVDVNRGTGTKAVAEVHSSAKPITETARIRIPIKIERTKRLAELTPDDIPPGLDPEDVATDAE